jgi:predicted  nucleic acid-binding Zn-ribbon protein
MGLFGGNIRKIVQEFRLLNEHYSNDLSKEIQNSLQDLKTEYDEYSTTVPEFRDFVDDLKTRLSAEDAQRLESFSERFSRLNRTAQHGVDALYDLHRNQKKLTSENRSYYEQYEN